MEVAMTKPKMVTEGAPALQYGDVDSALKEADMVVTGRFKMGSQYHFQVLNAVYLNHILEC